MQFQLRPNCGGYRFCRAENIEIAQDKVRGDFSHIRDVIVTSYSGLEAMINDPESMTGVKTGFLIWTERSLASVAATS